MANMYISEYSAVAHAKNDPTVNYGQAIQDAGIALQIPMEPPVTTPQKIVFSASAQSVAFHDNVKFICIHLDADGHVAVGENPTATTSYRKLLAGVDYYVGVTPGHKIAAITAV